MSDKQPPRFRPKPRVVALAFVSATEVLEQCISYNYVGRIMDTFDSWSWGDTLYTLVGNNEFVEAVMEAVESIDGAVWNSTKAELKAKLRQVVGDHYVNLD